MKVIKHSGWGRTHSSFSNCYEVDEVTQSLFNENQCGLAIGLGRSYGDSSISSDGLYIKVNNTKNYNTPTIYLG
jgi:hypothetical protein